MSTFPPSVGFGFLGAFAADRMPSPLVSNELQLIYVYDSGNGAYMYSDGTQWKPLGGDELAKPRYRVGILGASTTERMNVLYACANSTYSRRKVNGVGIATVRTNTPIETVLNVGRKFRLTCDRYPQIEGTFTLLSATVESGGHRLTWVDDRDDLGPSAIPGSANIHYIDPQLYTCSSGVMSHLSMCSGGRVDPVIVAVGGTNIVDDWSAPSSISYNRIDQLLSQGPFGAVVIGAGVFGDALLAGHGADEIYDALKTMCRRLRGAAPRVFVETPTSSRNVIPSSNAPFDSGTMGGIYTAGAIVQRRIWRDLVAECPNVTIIPVNETLTTTVVGTYSGSDVDVTNGWGPADNFNSDGTHYAYGNARAMGATWARILNTEFLPWRPDAGSAPDNVWSAPYVDPDGNFNPNAHSAWYGTVPTISSGATVTGVMPQGCAVSVANGTVNMSGTSAVVFNPEGGSDWILTFVDTGAGSGAGQIITLKDGGYTGQKLLTKLQANPGKALEIWVNPMLSDFIDNTMKAWGCTLMLDYGSGLLPHCGTDDLGLYKQGAIGRAMNAGFDGPFRMPTTTVPLDSASLVDAQLQFTLYAVPSVSVGTNVTFGLRVGSRVDIY
jgi:hypothetical protein